MLLFFIFKFLFDGPYFRLQFCEFTHFGFEKALGQCSFFADASGGELIEITALIVALDKVFDFYQTFVQQSFETIIKFAETYFQAGGQVALVSVRAVFEGFEQFVGYFVVHGS